MFNRLVKNRVRYESDVDKATTVSYFAVLLVNLLTNI